MSEKKTLITRRSFALGTGAVVAMFGLGGLKFVEYDPIIRPPGGQDEELLVSACIRCEKCLEVCPRNVITSAHIEKGVLVMRTPTFDFSRDYCDWCEEGNNGDPLCVKVCPTDALQLPADATPENTIIGKAVLNTELCLAYKLIGCRFCYDACPYEAIVMDDENIPHVLEDPCNGCGACESVCVSLQNASLASNASERAIVIRPT